MQLNNRELVILEMCLTNSVYFEKATLVKEENLSNFQIEVLKLWNKLNDYNSNK